MNTSDSTKRRKVCPTDRNRVFCASNGKCFYCTRQIARDTFTVDHVWPLAEGGGYELNNLVAACPKCNLDKGNGLPTEGEIIAARELYVPKMPVVRRPYTGPKQDKKKKPVRALSKDPGLAFLQRQALVRPKFTKRERGANPHHHGLS